MSYPPKTLPVVPSNIPNTLKEPDQWAAWRWEKRGGRWTKPPINPATGGYARNNDPDTWRSFETAQRRMRNDRLPGVGFMFHPDDGFAGVDLDKCRDLESGNAGSGLSGATLRDHRAGLRALGVGSNRELQEHDRRPCSLAFRRLLGDHLAALLREHRQRP
jgi:hypothetical protein